MHKEIDSSKARPQSGRSISKAIHPRRPALPLTDGVRTACPGCGITINPDRAYPLAFPCHREAQGVFCLRCFAEVALAHLPHLHTLREEDIA
jgi:hypothetical protein